MRGDNLPVGPLRQWIVMKRRAKSSPSTGTPPIPQVSCLPQKKIYLRHGVDALFYQPFATVYVNYRGTNF